jgi:tRNA pseudouridine55 synthase
VSREAGPDRPAWRRGDPGAVAIDKPAGMTSHDVVARVRRVLGERRVGHGGTLDPDATGALVVAVGAATRLLRFVADLSKSYTGEVVLGVETTTLDSSGEVAAVHDMDGVAWADIAAAAGRLTGRITQLPPMVSAVQVGGRRLYELARQGLEVERPPRQVEVYRFEVAPGSEPGCVRIEVCCSSGTYVRSLAADLGRALGGGAHLRNLRRTCVGRFGGERLVDLEELAPGHVEPPLRLVEHLANLAVGSPLAAAVAHGAVLDGAKLDAQGTGPWAIVDGSGTLLAVYERQSTGRMKPAVVLPPPTPRHDVPDPPAGPGATPHAGPGAMPDPPAGPGAPAAGGTARG